MCMTSWRGNVTVLLQSDVIFVLFAALGYINKRKRQHQEHTNRTWHIHMYQTLNRRMSDAVQIAQTVTV